jgi:NAD(P)H-nitrite reductase large subunit
VTGSQRLDLLGVKKDDLPKVWADLGMPSGQAYAKGVRMVKTCVGTDFCRFGTQDSTSAGIELERRLENLFTPAKVKMGVVGCPRNCAEATVKNIGMIGQDGSWQVVVGGAAGKSVRKADLLVTVETTEKALEACAVFFQYYREQANYLERTYDFVERVGIDQVRRETIYASEEVQRALLDRLAKSKALSLRRLAGARQSAHGNTVHTNSTDGHGGTMSMEPRSTELRSMNPEAPNPAGYASRSRKISHCARDAASNSMATRSHSSIWATASSQSKTAARIAAVP